MRRVTSSHVINGSTCCEQQHFIEDLSWPNDCDQRLATKGLSMQPDFIASPLHRLVLRLLNRLRRSVALLIPL
jgi:hypothetical protein